MISVSCHYEWDDFSSYGGSCRQIKQFPFVIHHPEQGAFAGLPCTDDNYTGKIAEIFLDELVILPLHYMAF